MRSSVSPVLAVVLFLFGVAGPMGSPGDAAGREPRRDASSALAGSSARAGAVHTPELGEAAVVSTSPKIVAEVAGQHLGSQEGKLKVGGKRAHVISWSDDLIVFQVPGKRRGGTHAVEVQTSLGEPQYPAALSVPGSPRLREKMQFRKTRRARVERYNYRAGSDALTHSFQRRAGYLGKKTWCHWVRDDDCFLWCSLEHRCHDVPVRRFHYWRAGVRFPADVSDDELPRVCTSADDLSSPPVWYDTPESYFRADETADSWWIVVGRDAGGRLCGEFRAVVVNSSGKSRKVSGRFAGGP